ncbi:DUF58 domain-containing protein [Pseudomonas segetis]|uniref:Uncharacterized conserved protein, DUF58 family, contains vWF domain n=1 Tax=Pseudomonas segetis TaxID=298908 RepID=A0A239ADG2_9PSED|nr:DUF58 domain-containing protein [Pseudomonas segetis]SNR93610.1 Uncharacterized conserved protein, DUF58 family, contains vWF domain [Pseudomonas segetis]
MIQGLQSRWNRWLARRIPPAKNLRLSQRQIFIIPSRVGAMFILALILMLLAAINYQNSLAYGLTFLLGSVFIVAILHTYLNLSGLMLKSGPAEPVFVGEHARFNVRLESERRAHEAIVLGWPSQGMLQLDVAALSGSDAELGLPATSRGWLRPGRVRVESRFPLGILVAWSWVDLDLQLLVYPRPVEGDLPIGAGLGDDPQEQGARAHGSGADDFQGLRAYQPSDSKRRLHWKAYSRGLGLLVKDFTALSGRDISLDFSALASDTEARLSLLCYWVLQLSERQQPFSLALPGVYIGVDSGEQHRDRCLRALTLFGSSFAEPGAPA